MLLAPKPKGTYRVVHQLDPIDSLIFTALLYENSSLIESYRVPEKRKIACSYRIKPNAEGSFFDNNNPGYSDFLKKSEELMEKHSSGVVLVCDIIDFYNQIYLHRVNNILSEAGSRDGDIIESFLSGLNTNTSRGVPVGPAPGIIIAESIMGDIDKKILSHTDLFTRYVDDIYIFFETEHEARYFLHELTQYLHSSHRLVLSSDKTKIMSVSIFRKKYLQDEENIERQSIHEKLEKLTMDCYHFPEEVLDFDSLENSKKFEIRTEVFSDLFEKAVATGVINMGLMKYILRRAGQCRSRKIIPQIFAHFDLLLPVIRDVVIYFERVLSEKTVTRYEVGFKSLLDNNHLTFPFVNMWVYTLFQNEHFNAIDLKIDYSKILRIREQALIAKREKNLTWLKGLKDRLDILGAWDKRAVIYASTILSKDEMIHWLALESSKGDILNKSVCSMAISDKKSE